MSSSSTTAHHSRRTSGLAAIAATAAESASTSASLAGPPAIMANSDASLDAPAAQDLEAAAAAAKEDDEDDQGDLSSSSPRPTLRFMDPRSVTPAQLHEFSRRSLLPFDHPDWRDPAGGIPPRDKDGKIPAEYMEMLVLMFYQLHKRQGGTGQDLVEAVQEAAAGRLDD